VECGAEVAVNRPAEAGVGVEPVSKRLRERQARQWAVTWAKEMAEVDENKARREAGKEGTHGD
jgi:hypothetical protein